MWHLASRWQPAGKIHYSLFGLTNRSCQPTTDATAPGAEVHSRQGGKNVTDADPWIAGIDVSRPGTETRPPRRHRLAAWQGRKQGHVQIR